MDGQFVKQLFKLIELVKQLFKLIELVKQLLEQFLCVRAENR